LLYEDRFHEHKSLLRKLCLGV